MPRAKPACASRRSAALVAFIAASGLLASIALAGGGAAGKSLTTASDASVKVNQDGGPAAGPNLWVRLASIPADQELMPALVRPIRGQAFALDPITMQAELAKAPIEGAQAGGAQVGGVQGRAAPMVISIPMPDGSLQRFSVMESPVMEPDLAARYPSIKSYAGQSLDRPATTVRFDVSPQGFRAQILSPEGTVYVDPYSRNNNVLHTSYYKKDFSKEAPSFKCGTDAGPAALLGLGGVPALRAATPATLRTFRIAVCVTGEWATANGGTVPSALAAVNTVVNRISGVYEADFSVRLVLVANNDQLIFTNAATDPFTAVTNPSTSNTQSQNTINSVIGTANYDVGHIFHFDPANPNGLAGGIGTVCGSIKGQGYSAGVANGDPFSIDYAAHEIGHQFGGRHPFSNCNGAAGDSANVAVEPGSGNTIMAYAGICGGNNLQANSDPYFNGINVQQVLTYVASQSCQTTVANSNTIPVITFPGAASTAMPPAAPASTYTIPARTPFALTAIASDADNDALTYCWEQQNGTSGTGLPVTDSGANPICRSFNPTTSPTRIVPRLANLLAGTTFPGEILPTTTRSMLWRCTVRDNRSGGGGVQQGDLGISVTSAAGPFTVTSQTTSASVSGSILVTWNVANTNVAPVSCANVRISLSTDGGLTFPTVLASSVPNTGSASVTLPAINTSQARIRVEAVGNIFFNINSTNFTIFQPSQTPSLQSGGAPSIADSTGNGNNNGRAEPGESDIRVFVPVTNSGLNTATGVVGTLTTTTPTVSIVTGTQAYSAVAFGAVVTNTPGFQIFVLPSHPCGTPINLQAVITDSTGSSYTTSFSIPSGTPAGPGTAQSFSFVGAINIPDANPAGINAVVPVSGLGTSIFDVVFSFDGTSCNTTATSPTVGLSHSYVGDLVVRLTSPAGTTVTLMSNPGTGTFGSSGNNFCNTVLQDGAASSIQTIPAAGAPYTGTFSPFSPLAGFSNQNPNGNWTLTVVDNASGDTGTLRAFTIRIRTRTGDICTPPLAVTGACCLSDGSCSIFTSSSCASSNGTYQGDGSACASVSCPQPSGACCFSGGSCSLLTAASCASETGTYQGNNVACGPTTCPLPQGACCLGANVCQINTQPACESAGGSYQGNGSSCDPTPCPVELGACCTGGATCVLTPSASSCPSGIWAGFGTTCNVSGNRITPCCYADFNLSGAVDVQDIFAFLAAWFARSPNADIDQNTIIDVTDIFGFLAAWFARC